MKKRELIPLKVYSFLFSNKGPLNIELIVKRSKQKVSKVVLAKMANTMETLPRTLS